jgi:hypothetical protein
MSTRTVPPRLTLQGDRPGVLRTFLALAATALVLLGSWAVLIALVVLAVRAFS